MTTLPHSNGERQKLKYFDTFTGIGGFTVALSELGHECIGFSEIDRYASSVYSYHFPSHHNYGDITRITELPDFDLLVGGFPCQAFSVAGKRRGFADTRGTLFFDLARILQSKRPRYFVFENVKGLLSHDGGSTFKTIIATLDELGYGYQWQVLNSKHFGVAQNRERVFIVGHLGGTPRPEVFPLGEGGGEPDAAHADSGARIGRWVNKNSGVVLDDTAPALRASGGTDIRKIPVVIDHGARTVIKSCAIRGREGRTNLEIRSDDIAGTVRSTLGGLPLATDGIAIRKLTPVECERLQGFPDNWTQWGVERKPNTNELGGLPYKDCLRLISDTQRYKMCGNAVTVNVVREIVTKLNHETTT